jgi:hypothetical protein
MGAACAWKGVDVRNLDHREIRRTRSELFPVGVPHGTAANFRCGDVVKSTSAGWIGQVDYVIGENVGCIVREADGAIRRYCPKAEYIEMLQPMFIHGDRVAPIKDLAEKYKFKWDLGEVLKIYGRMIEVKKDFDSVTEYLFREEIERVHLAVPVGEDPELPVGKAICVDDGETDSLIRVACVATDRHRNILVAVDGDDHRGKLYVVAHSRLIDVEEDEPLTARPRTGDFVSVRSGEDAEVRGYVTREDMGDGNTVVYAPGKDRSLYEKVENLEVIGGNEVPGDTHRTWSVLRSLRTGRFWIKLPSGQWHAISDGVDWTTFWPRNMA